MSQQQLRNTYNGLKSDFTTTQQNAQIRLQAQQQLNHSHFKKSMQNLEDQFAEAERQRKLQQQLLRKHYEHQKYLMRKRHQELLMIKNKLKDINSHEQHQIGMEQHLQQKHQRLLDIQRDYQMRSEKTNTQRDLLEQRKKAILDEMKQFDALTQSMGQLNLQGQLTEEQKKLMEELRTGDNLSMPPMLSSVYTTDEFVDDDDDDYYEDDDYHYRHPRRPRHRRSRSQIRRYSRRRKSFKIRSRSPQSCDRRRSSRRRRISGRSSRRRSSTRRLEGSDSRSRSMRRSSRPRKMEMDIEYQSRSGTLYVRLIHARGVFGKQGTKPNTFVELECGDEMYQSSTIKKSNNPSWNEYFKFHIKDYKHQTLTLRLVDARNNRSITKMRVPVYQFVERADLSQKRSRSKNYPMNDNCSINMDVAYENRR